VIAAKVFSLPARSLLLNAGASRFTAAEREQGLRITTRDLKTYGIMEALPGLRLLTSIRDVACFSLGPSGVNLSVRDGVNSRLPCRWNTNA